MRLLHFVEVSHKIYRNQPTLSEKLRDDDDDGDERVPLNSIASMKEAVKKYIKYQSEKTMQVEGCITLHQEIQYIIYTVKTIDSANIAGVGSGTRK